MVKYSRYQANFSFIYLKNNLNFILKVLRNKNNQNISKHFFEISPKFFPTNFQTSLKRMEYFMDIQTSLTGMQHFSGKVLWIVFYLSDARWRKHVIYIILKFRYTKYYTTK
jgi:hypothetical protein